MWTTLFQPREPPVEETLNVESLRLLLERRVLTVVKWLLWAVSVFMVCVMHYGAFAYVFMPGAYGTLLFYFIANGLITYCVWVRPTLPLPMSVLTIEVAMPMSSATGSP